MTQPAMINAMSVDVEDYFQVSAFEPIIKRQDWDSMPCRVEQNTHRVMDIFDQHNVKATFFILGWVAERYPSLVKRIVADGHELASHGYQHTRVTEQTPDEFRADVTRTKAMLEDMGGVKIRGYRAASYSIGASNLWALQILEETGHEYSSSIYPSHHDLYGMPGAPRFQFRPNGDDGLIEVPVTTFTMGKRRFPCGGGGYFRLFPYPLYRWAVNKVNGQDGESSMFYFHPWEIDPEQPRQQNISAKTRFRHYLNLERMESRLHRLLNDFQWDRMDRVFIDAVKRTA